MNRKKTFILGLIIMNAILVSAAIIYQGGSIASYQQDKQVSTASGNAVLAFYTEYLAYPGNPLVDKTYQNDERLTDVFKVTLDEITVGPMSYDPVLCAQDRPETVVVENVVVTGEGAVALVKTSFDGHSFDVLLTQEDGEWKIDGVNCTVK